MAKYIEVISGKNKGLKCFVRNNTTNGFFTTFDGQILDMAECKVIEYEKNWVPTKDNGCRYRE